MMIYASITKIMLELGIVETITRVDIIEKTIETIIRKRLAKDFIVLFLVTQGKLFSFCT